MTDISVIWPLRGSFWWRIYPSCGTQRVKHRRMQRYAPPPPLTTPYAEARCKTFYFLWTAGCLSIQLLLINFSDLRQHPFEAILVIFGRRALIIFCFKALEEKWKMTPLLCTCAVVITLETQKRRKRAPRSVEFNFFIICDGHKRFSQNERRGIDLQNVATDFFIFAYGLTYNLSKFSDDFTPFFFNFERP